MEDGNRSTEFILNFYSFCFIDKKEFLASKVFLLGKEKNIKGTVLIAEEGFNGSIIGKKESLYYLLEEILSMTNSKQIDIKIDSYQRQPFKKFKVKLKQEIISMKTGYLDVPSIRGDYVTPENWHATSFQQNTLIIDVRNNYEISLGVFKGAILPGIKVFSELPKWIDFNKEKLLGKRLAMYCTGGIRCEKATAYMKNLGFNNVYQLKGGIIQYLKETKNQANYWQGSCFVFDNRHYI